jgi:hypothetical protein
VIIFGNGRFRIDQNDLLADGEYSSKQIEQAISDLKRGGWSMVAVIDRNMSGSFALQDGGTRRDARNSGRKGIKGLDIYFRRILEPNTV